MLPGRIGFPGILLGQLVALSVAVLSLISKSLTEFHHVSCPALQIALGYLAVFLLFLPPHLRLSKPPTPPPASSSSLSPHHVLLILLAIAVCDSQGDYFTTAAFKYGASIASFGILTSFTVPFAMVLSYGLLRARYAGNHYAGAGVALVGIALVLLADQRTSTSHHPADGPGVVSVTGDLMLVLGSASWACANVACEALFRRAHTPIPTYLVTVSFFGCAIASTMAWAWELDDAFNAASHHAAVYWLFALYAVLFALNYFIYAAFLERYDAVLVNLSVLTADVWGALFAYFIFDEPIPRTKYAAFACAAVGILLYSQTAPQSSTSSGEEEQQQQEQEEAPYRALL